MFKLVIVIFYIINGSPSEKPAGVLAYKQATFQSEEACLEFSASETGKAVKRDADEMVASQGGKITARIGCVKIDKPADDGSI
jgi:hypothetical protein